MSISLQEFQRRHAAIRDLMKKDGLDSLLIVGLNDDFSRGNIRYVTGLGRGGCCIFPSEGAPVFLADPIFLTSPKLPRFMSGRDLLDLRGTFLPVEQALVELSRFDMGNKVGLVGRSCISVPMYLAVTEKFGNRLVDSVEILESLRAVKNAEEIEKMRTAASVADKVYEKLREIIRPGLGEYEIYGEVKKVIYGMGCEYSFDLIDGAGAAMNMSFFPTEDKLEATGTLFMEITPAYDGYYAQLPVTLPVSDYPPHVRRMVSAWSQADKAARRILGPGTRVCELYRVLMSAVHEKGFISPFRPGHFIGLEVLDFWSITESSDRVLKPGMTLAIHPSVLAEIGGDGCGMGYTYLITETGAERLSKIDLARELIGDEA
jgi:Xaa-Pro aminopeptidase